MHISLRKKTPEPEPETVEEPLAEAEETDREAPAENDEEAPGLPRALAAAVRAWLAWCTSRTNVTVTYWVHGIAVWATAYYGGWIAIGIVAALVTGVGSFIPRATVDRITARVEARQQAPADDESEPAEEPPADPLVGLLRHLIGDAPGVHLKTLVEHLEKGAAEVGQQPPRKADVVAKLAARNIRLRPSVRDVHGRVNRGVYRADLEAAPAPSPDESTVTGPDP
ncbi:MULTISPECIES: hypothetical protein [Streptomyces]